MSATVASGGFAALVTGIRRRIRPLGRVGLVVCSVVPSCHPDGNG